MGWFDEQIRLRIEEDQLRFSEAFNDMAGVVMGRKAFLDSAAGKETQFRGAVEEILRYYGAKPGKVPDNISEPGDQLEYMLRPTGIMRRNVTLPDGWYRDAAGAMLCQTEDGDLVAVLPGVLGGYHFTDPKTGSRVRLNRSTQDRLSGEAICFYRPLPLKKLGIPDLMLFMIRSLSIADGIYAGVITLLATLVGLLPAYSQKILFGTVAKSGNSSLLVPIAVLLLGVTVSMALLNITKNIVMQRISAKLNLAVEAAAMMRTLSLPADFFRTYSAGELSSRINHLQSLASMLADALLTTGLTSVFSLVYIAQIFRFAPGLVIPSLAVILATLAVSVISTFLQMRISEQKLALAASNSGLVYALICGVQKIKLAGAERRAFAKWAREYAPEAELSYNPPAVIKYNSVLTTAISLAGTIILYYFAVRTNVSTADYRAFNYAYGMVSGAFTSLAGIALTAANIRPVMSMVEPILKTVPETSESRRIISRLSGSVELNNVCFRYSDDMPMVLDDLTLKIRPGQYVAIVGKTGCGKSTLIRLLLGFEHPEKGAIYYDGQDIDSLDLHSVRRNIGVVLQDGKLFQGDLYSNITISAPELSMDDAWEAAEMAGIADDIRAMPMGMHTLISSEGGSISGGQAQRIMIARAIAPKPKILIFDEATSALDNITQRRVSEALNGLRCTRIVVAHRLSTIRQCNRIVVLDGGKIIQDGTYDELMQDRNGLFYELVERQQTKVPEPSAGPEA